MLRGSKPEGITTSPLIILCCRLPLRGSALQVIGDAFAAAARPAKGGFVRDALIASYPKLVSLLESSFARIQTESRIKVGLRYQRGDAQAFELL